MWRSTSVNGEPVLAVNRARTAEKNKRLVSTVATTLKTVNCQTKFDDE
jgi:hypothetical protein